MNKIRVTKYKLIDADISEDIAKKIVGRQFTVEKVKSEGGPGSDGGRKPLKQRKAPAWFIEFRDEQREFNTRIEKDIANLKNDISLVKKTQSRQEEHFKNLENRMDKQDARLINIESRLDRQEKRIENIEHNLSI